MLMATVGAGFLLTGCGTPKNITYFQNEESIVQMAQANPIKLKADDKLSIVVKSKDPAVSDLFNLGIYTSRYGTNGAQVISGSQVKSFRPGSNDGVSYYTVDPQGCIDFPVLGSLKVAGMTRSELSGFIKGELMGRELVKDPTVTVEFVNTGINVMGEVMTPGRYDINRDHLTVLDALSLAGDLTINGRRENVKVLREENGQTKVYTLDLTDLNKLVKSPAYSLQQNDVVYVEPNDFRKRQTTVNGNNALSTGFWISVASLITSAVTTIGVFVNK